MEPQLMGQRLLKQSSNQDCDEYSTLSESLGTCVRKPWDDYRSCAAEVSRETCNPGYENSNNNINNINNNTWIQEHCEKSCEPYQKKDVDYREKIEIVPSKRIEPNELHSDTDYTKTIIKRCYAFDENTFNCVEINVPSEKVLTLTKHLSSSSNRYKLLPGSIVEENNMSCSREPIITMRGEYKVNKAAVCTLNGTEENNDKAIEHLQDTFTPYIMNIIKNMK